MSDLTTIYVTRHVIGDGSKIQKGKARLSKNLVGQTVWFRKWDELRLGLDFFLCEDEARQDASMRISKRVTQLQNQIDKLKHDPISFIDLEH